MQLINQFWALTLLISYIGVATYATKPNIKKEVSPVEMAIKSKIAFLSFGIFQKNNGKITIELLDKIVVDGVLKPAASDSKKGKHGDLACMVLDMNSKVQRIKYIPNPLQKNIEYVNTSKQFRRKEVIFDQAQFSVRIQLSENAKYVILKQVDTLTVESPVLFSCVIG